MAWLELHERFTAMMIQDMIMYIVNLIVILSIAGRKEFGIVLFGILDKKLLDSKHE